MATRRNSTRRSRTPLELFAPRNLWLAALGAAALARREAGSAAASAFATGQRLAGIAITARGAACGHVAGLRDGVEPVIGGFSAEVEARLAPVLDKLGLAPAKPGSKPAKGRRPAAKKPAAARRPARKAPARKAAPARKRTAG